MCFCQKGSGHIGQKHWQLLESFSACRCTASMLLQPTLQAFLSVHKLSPLFFGSGSFCIRNTKFWCSFSHFCWAKCRRAALLRSCQQKEVYHNPKRSSACCKTSSEMWNAALSQIIPIFFPGYKAFTHESYFLASILSIKWLFWKQTLLGPSYYLSHCLLKRPSVAPSNIRKGVKNKELKSSIPSIPVRPFFSLVSFVEPTLFAPTGATACLTSG